MSSFEEYYYKNVGKQVRKYRLAAGYTQEELSEILSKNDKYIGHIERCERKISTKVMVKLFDILKIQPSEFFAFETDYNWQEK